MEVFMTEVEGALCREIAAAYDHKYLNVNLIVFDRPQIRCHIDSETMDLNEEGGWHVEVWSLLSRDVPLEAHHGIELGDLAKKLRKEVHGP
jgi:hypothetical protein